MPKLTAEKLQAELAQKKMSSVYLLTGEDTYRKQEIINQIREILQPDDFNFYTSSADKADLGEVLAMANTAPVFSVSRLLVLTGIEKLRKEPKEALLRYIENPLSTTTLVLTHNDSKKMKTEKALAAACGAAGCVTEFAELKQAELNIWIKNRLSARGLTGNFDAVELLCQSVGSELAALENEIEKLYLYTLARENKTITKEDVLACIGFSKEENPYELANAILACNKTRAIQLVDKLLDDGEEPVAILAKMTYPIEKMARIKRMSEGGMAAGDIVHAAGLFPWESRLVSAARNYPSQQQFLAAMNRMIEADAGLKSGTASDPKITLKGILLTLFR
ncbi:MAG: DNA polymerase III subunit delta [Elusimicrobiaceae bacterium]|nr:DNA polymerase III subunit delta [Elusimicrobiaceae bacterium]